MRAAGRESPSHDSRLRLFDVPSWCLLAAVVPPAFRFQVALAGRAARMRCGVVDVAVNGLCQAAGCGAGGGPGADQMPEAAAGQVLGISARVVTGAFGNGTEGDVEAAEQSG